MSAPDLAALLAEHADCLTNCDVRPLGVHDGRMRYEVRFTCGVALPLPADAHPRDHDANHLAAVLTAAGYVHGPTARAEAWDEGYEANDNRVRGCDNPYR